MSNEQGDAGERVTLSREEVARRSGELEGAASGVSYGVQTPEQHEALVALLLNTASWLCAALPTPPDRGTE